MAVNVVAVDNAPELLEKIEGIFRNMAEVSLLEVSKKQWL